MSNNPPCAERSGFLFKHACKRPGVMQCSQCAKQICHEHTTKGQGNTTVCVSCLKSTGKSSYGSSSHRHNPYFYGYNHYDGWGSSRRYHNRQHDDHDSGDFTEADGGATEYEGDEGFETDMEGS